MASFLVISDSGDQKLLTSEKRELRIGRLPECEIFLDEAVVSRKHAKVYFDASKYYVQDTGSRNGTLVNGKPISKPTDLCPGDTIAVGSSKIVYEQPASLFDSEQDMATQTIIMSHPALPSSVEAITSFALLEIVADISRQIVLNRPLEGLLDHILSVCLDRTGAERAAILLFDNKGELVPRAYHSKTRSHPRFLISRGIAQKAIDERQSVLVEDTSRDEELRLRESVIGLGIRSAICSPMCDGEKTVGLLYIDTSEPDRPFGEMDLLFFTTLSGMIAEKLKSVILSDIAKAKQSLDEELKIARKIQSQLFPREIQQIKGYDLSAFNRPCREVGGDYFDIIAIDDAFGVAIGDVAGKGLGPAMLMSNLQGIARSRALEYADPAALLKKLNSDLLGRVGDDRFITFFYLVLDPQQGRLIYSNAGQNYPLLWRKSGTVSRLSGSGVPLGIFAESSYEAFTINLESGDVLLLYSDGITECINNAGDFFGEQRLEKVLAQSAQADAEGIKDAILSAVDDFRQDEPYSDDRTLVILKKV